MAQYRQSGHHHYLNGASSSSSDHVSIGIRASSSSQPGRFRRSVRSDKAHRSGSSIGSIIVVLCGVLLVTVLAYYYISTNDDTEKSIEKTDHSDENDVDFLANVTRMNSFKVLGFGKGSVSHGRDSRYWDRDDRRRDEDYDEDDVKHSSDTVGDKLTVKENNPDVNNDQQKVSQVNPSKDQNRKGVGLYNEDGRKELKMYEAEYEASLKNAGQGQKESSLKSQLLDDEDHLQQHGGNDYDDGIDSHDPRIEDYDESELSMEDLSELVTSQSKDVRESSNFLGVDNLHQTAKDVSESSTDSDSTISHVIHRQPPSKLRPDSKKKPRRKRFSGSCEMKFLNSTAQLVEPLESRKFARFSLQYIETEERPSGEDHWQPRFAGHQSLQEREESFLVQEQKKIHCGFVKGPQGSPSTGFDLSEDDENYISKCHIAVSSCIFGNSDRLRSPVAKMVSRLSRKNVCFVMFTDESTVQTLSSEGHVPDRAGFIGLWKIVVVKNLPYDDMRKVGKIPKLLPHRLFPSARYSIWLDSKLRLQLDPLLMLEYFLWRKGHEYAISNHYDRHCVWEEVAQNKKLNKYNHTVIDEQFAFYRADGLQRFNASDPKKLLPSNVPEGSLIVRAHTPMSNLFSCLWFNEVDRFTSRDQLSFAYTYQKLRRVNNGKLFYLNMFKDCERRAVAKLFRHRSEEKRNLLLQQQATE